MYLKSCFWAIGVWHFYQKLIKCHVSKSTLIEILMIDVRRTCLGFDEKVYTTKHANFS
jgi:hypothetical protein